MRFISEPVTVGFDEEPALSKRPRCPDRFTWQGETFHVARKLKEWHDYGRRGRMAHNMRPAHLEAARRRGSWGVGRDYYRVRTGEERVLVSVPGAGGGGVGLAGEGGRFLSSLRSDRNDGGEGLGSE